MKPSPVQPDPDSRQQAQQSADHIRLLREELAIPELQQILQLTPDQQSPFDDWSRAQLTQLSLQYDVDTSASQTRISWGIRIAVTLGGLAICAALVLFFMRYWGYFETPVQIAILAAIPLLALISTEFAATRERTLYLSGLLSLVAFVAFVMNLMVLGSIFNVISTERALLAWSAFALLMAYRYGLRLQLSLGLLLFIGYAAAFVTAQVGLPWFNFTERPELIAFLALLVFFAPFALPHQRHGNFPAVYRLIGALVFFLALISLAEWGLSSYLPFSRHNVERLYELAGLLTSAGAIWMGILRHWKGVVSTSATAFVIFLYTRLYHWWWDWMPKYLFFAVIGALPILVLAFKRMRVQMSPDGVLT